MIAETAEAVESAEASPNDPLARRIAEAHARATELEARRRELALDALGDPKARKQLEGAEADLAAVRREREQLELARTEREKREAQARSEAEREAQAQALARSQALERRCHAAARKFDGNMQSAGEAAAELLRLREEQSAAFVQAGQAALPGSFAVPQAALDGAIAFALSRAGVPNWLIGRGIGDARPLAGGDA